MKILSSINTMWYLLFGVFCFATVSCQDVSGMGKEKHQVIDIYIQRLQEETWEEEDAPCLEKTLSLLENVKNFTLWATWVWNANSLPAGNLYASLATYGNFDQCMKPPWLDTHPQFKTKYCLAEVTLSDKMKKISEFDPYGSTEEYLNSPTLMRFPVNFLLWGVCVPATCNPPSIVKMIRAMYDITNFGTGTPNITVGHCQEAGTKQQYPMGFYLFFGLIAALMTIAAVSTYYQHCYPEDLSPNSIVSIITKSFCIIKNQQDLVKENKEEIKVMNGMRFITAMSMVPLHVVYFMFFSGLSNMLDDNKELDEKAGLSLHIEVLVDTFLAMSGLLHIKGLLANAERQQNLFKVLWKRYMRLIGPFALTIFYLTSVSKYTGSGPIWIKKNQEESEVCSKNWKLSLLMLNTDVKNLCHMVTWYISCDYQLAILGTVLFFFYHKHRRLGFAAFGTAVVFSLIIPAALTYWLRLPPIHFLELGKYLLYPRNYWELNYTYTPSYSRAGAYLVGVAMGYLMTIYRPADYRNAIAKSWSVIGTALSLIVMYFVLSLGAIYIKREYSPMEAAFTAASNRIAWAIAVCCIIGLCEYGTVPVLSDFLGKSIFTPLGRLSYGIYIIHTLILQRNKFVLRAPFTFDVFPIITDSIGTLMISIALSYLMWLLVEAPLINLSNQLLFNRSKEKELKKVTENGQNGIQHSNGHFKTKSL